MTRILALADDATGALEVGAQFARAGTPARVWFGEGIPAKVDDPTAVLIVDTETRHLSAECAYQRVRSLATPDCDHVFKKTDSTLRGNIGAEFRALMDSYPGRPLVYAPAYPKLGRTVVEGRLYVDGRPLEETAFARDPLNPACESSIPEVLHDCGVPVIVSKNPGSELPALLRRKEGSRVVYVCNGSTDDELGAIAGILGSCGQAVLAAGTGAFAGLWVRRFSGAAAASRTTVGRCLVVNGSLHPVSRQQIESVSIEGWPILTSPGARSDNPLAVSASLAIAVCENLESGDFDGLVVFGGDTLYAILKVLGIDMLLACDELLPGVALTKGRWRDRDLWFITKAGGFGQPDVLHSIRCCLEKRS